VKGTQEGRLSASGGPDKRSNRMFVDAEVDILQHVVIPVVRIYILSDDHFHICLPIDLLLPAVTKIYRYPVHAERYRQQDNDCRRTVHQEGLLRTGYPVEYLHGEYRKFVHRRTGDKRNIRQRSNNNQWRRFSYGPR